MSEISTVDFELDPVTIQEPRQPAQEPRNPLDEPAGQTAVPEAPLQEAQILKMPQASNSPVPPQASNSPVPPQASQATAPEAAPKKAPARFTITWRDAFNTGISQVDKDHRHLFSLISMLEVSTVHHVLDELLSYVAEHFQHEEELMHLSGYPEMEEHVRQHEQLTNTVAKLVSSVVTWTPETVDQFRSFGLKWLVGHILNTDAKFGRWFREHPIDYNMDAEGHYHKVQKSWWARVLKRST